MDDSAAGAVADVGFLSGSALDIAPRLLNCVVSSTIDDAVVTLRISEVEAYLGIGEDPGSHAFRQMTKRNRSMFLPPGHLYVYRSYGVHWCVNLVVGEPDHASAVLVRAGEVIAGRDLAVRRRETTATVRRDSEIARGPGRLTSALGITGAQDGSWLLGGGPVTLRLPAEGHPVSGPEVRRSTRTGVSGPGACLEYRFYLKDDATVSKHRPVQSASSREASPN